MSAAWRTNAGWRTNAASTTNAGWRTNAASKAVRPATPGMRCRGRRSIGVSAAPGRGAASRERLKDFSRLGWGRANPCPSDRPDHERGHRTCLSAAIGPSGRRRARAVEEHDRSSRWSRRRCRSGHAQSGPHQRAAPCAEVYVKADRKPEHPPTRTPRSNTAPDHLRARPLLAAAQIWRRPGLAEGALNSPTYAHDRWRSSCAKRTVALAPWPSKLSGTRRS